MTATLTIRTFYSDEPEYVTDQEFAGTIEDMESSFTDVCTVLKEKGYTEDDSFKGDAIWNRVYSKWLDEVGARHVTCACLWNGN